MGRVIICRVEVHVRAVPLHPALLISPGLQAYVMMGYLIFGNSIEQFSTFGTSANTCFEMLLGNIDVNVALRSLGGLQVTSERRLSCFQTKCGMAGGTLTRIPVAVLPTHEDARAPLPRPSILIVLPYLPRFVQSFAGALYFWSYQVLVFLVLLNFLLAIIVDAFAEVKERTRETTGGSVEGRVQVGGKDGRVGCCRCWKRPGTGRLGG